MAYVDPNDNILKWENGDVVTPQAAKMNMHLDSVGTVTNALRRRGTYTVNNIPERTALVNTIGASNISNSNPLMVWRANADSGQRLEYTENGGNWFHVKTSQEPSQDTGWVTTGLNFTMGGSFTLLNYLFRRIGKQVIGEVNTTITSTINFGSTGNISDVNGVMYLPMEWANGNNAPQRKVSTVLPGVLEMFSRINNGSIRNRVDLTHGLPNTSITAGSTLRFYFDHTTD